ncbi:MAG: DUF6144 family protein [Clostridiaceae bacterium]|nr:DUF6144 family protein [Clostridiaceae bacterium]
MKIKRAYDPKAFAKSTAKVRHLAEALKRFGVEETVAAQILEGGEQITKPKDLRTTEWFHDAMRRLDALLPVELVNEIRESCACCTGGERRRLAQKIYRNNETVDARLKALDAAKLIVGHSARWEDGRIVVRFAENAEKAYCPCLVVTEEPMPVSYCRCCGGHIKGHLETALGVKTALRIRSSQLSSAGKEPCVMEFTVLQDAPQTADPDRDDGRGVCMESSGRSR